MSTNSEAPAWHEDPRVETTPTHYLIDVVGGYGPPMTDVEAELEREPSNLPPDKVRVKRSFTAGDQLELDNYPEATPEKERHQTIAFACILTGLPMRHMKRMNFADYSLVLDAVSEALAGKGRGAEG